MGDNDGFAMEKIRERRSNSFSSQNSSPDLKRRIPEENNTWENGEKSTVSINMSGNSTMVKMKRETSVISNSPDVVYTWSGLTIKTKQERRSIKDTILRREPPRPKTILRDVSGAVRPGELLAIMGASGAGKSTMLNALTFRNLSGLDVQGEIKANGVPITPTMVTSLSAYIQQDDMFIGILTVREQLEFQAKLRMDQHYSSKEKARRVDELLQELGLKKCENTRIGVPGRVKGISGGEMKRLAVACELLTNPPLLFCDEPTSGLDSFMAQNVVETLRNLAARGKTIVATIHQPSSQVFELFDRLMLLAEGRLAYLGPTTMAEDFFQSVGFQCPRNYNPADHYLKVLAIAPGEEVECRQRVDEICEKFDNSDKGTAIKVGIKDLHKHNMPGNLSVVDNDFKKYRANWGTQFLALQKRSWLTSIREPMLFHIRIIQTIFTAVLFGIVYLDQDPVTSKTVTNINGVLILVVIQLTFQNVFAVINTFCLELPVFLREHFNGTYRTDVYFITKQLADLPTFVLAPAMFIAILYWMVKLNPDFDRFLICMAAAVALTQAVNGFGYFISCLSPNVTIATAVGPAFILPFLLFGGFFTNPELVPSWLAWIEHISWFKYGNEILFVNQWVGVNITCPAGENCIYDTGEDVLQPYSFDVDKVPFDFGMLVVMAVAFRLLAYLALLMKTLRK